MRALNLRIGRQPVRYLISGGLCAIANNALLVGGTRAGLTIFQLILLSFLIIGTAGYVAHVYLTFRWTPGWSSYLRYMVGIAFGIPAAYGILALLCGGLHMPMLYAAPLATVTLLIYNYLSAHLTIIGYLFKR